MTYFKNWLNSSLLRVIEIPDGIEYDISDWDGLEMIEAVHMRWC